MQKLYGFPHSEKLKSVVRTSLLFNAGKSFWIFPCAVYYRIGRPEEIPASQVLVSVGKHYFKHAVDRNRIKRLLREAYRLNRQSLAGAAAQAGLCYNIGLVYKSRSIMDFAAIEGHVKAMLQKMEDIIRKAAACGA